MHKAQEHVGHEAREARERVRQEACRAQEHIRYESRGARERVGHKGHEARMIQQKDQILVERKQDMPLHTSFIRLS